MSDINHWNRNPIKEVDTLANEVVSRSLLYGILGFLPAEKCAVLMTDGQFSPNIAAAIETAGYAVTRLCDPSEEEIGCVPELIDNMPDNSFGLVITTGWPENSADLENTARIAFSKLREGGLYIGCAPNRFACALDTIASEKFSETVNILDDNVGDNGNWFDAKELFTPRNLSVTMEAIGYKIIELYGWQIALERIPKETLLKSNWTNDEIEEIASIEFRLSHEKYLLGCAPTIQFVVKKPNPSEDLIEESV